MSVKDGGAMGAVENAADKGAKLSMVIVELLIWLLWRARQEEEGSALQVEILSELQKVRERFLSLRSLALLGEEHEAMNDILTPAERVYGRSLSHINVNLKVGADQDVSPSLGM